MKWSWIFGLLFSATSYAQGLPFAFWKTASPPTFIQEAETVWNTTTSPKTTASFNVLAADVLVAYAIRENDSAGQDVTISGGSLDWFVVGAIDTNTSGFTEVRVWAAYVDADKAMTVTFTGPGSSQFGGNVFTFRNSAGIGASATANASGAPSVNITTTAASSAVVVVNGDWNAVDGATRSWRLNATEKTYSFSSGAYTAYGGYHGNIGAAGTYAVGLSLPVGQEFSTIAVEVKGGSPQAFCNGTISPAPGTARTRCPFCTGRK